MIDPKELRIGNHVLRDGETCVVMRIHDAGFYGVTPIKMVGLISNAGNELEPIPLTEEWLLRADFKKNEPFFKQYPGMPYWVNDGVCLFFNESDERNIYLLGFAEQRMGEYAAVGIRWIQYVHEPQNGFALKGKELEIKL